MPLSALDKEAPAREGEARPALKERPYPQAYRAAARDGSRGPQALRFTNLEPLLVECPLRAR